MANIPEMSHLKFSKRFLSKTLHQAEGKGYNELSQIKLRQSCFVVRSAPTRSILMRVNCHVKCFVHSQVVGRGKEWTFHSTCS